MGEVQVRDVMLWSSHVRNDNGLVALMETLPHGQTVELEVDGVVGCWTKARQGESEPTGHAPIPTALAKEHWHQLYNDRREEWVPVRALVAR